MKIKEFEQTSVELLSANKTRTIINYINGVRGHRHQRELIPVLDKKKKESNELILISDQVTEKQK